MGVTMFLICLLGALASGQAADTVDLQSTPALLIFGKENGEIWRCDFYNPTRCEVFYNVSSSFQSRWVNFIHVHGYLLYAGVGYGQLLQCEMYSNTSCTTFYPFDAKTEIKSLVVTGEHLYAGLRNGLMLRCKLDHLLRNCDSVRNFTDPVQSLRVFDKYIYVATTKSLFNCSNGKGRLDCSKVNDVRLIDLFKMSHLSRNIIKFIKLPLEDNQDNVWYYNTTSSSFKFEMTCDVAIFRRKIYVSSNSGVKMSLEHYDSFTNFVRQSECVYVAFAYGVRHMEIKRDMASCLGGRLPAAAFSAGGRWMVEVSVAGGRLVDAWGEVVDTREAGEGHSGRAGVFAMGPGGEILLTNQHRSGLAHIASFFAGGSVAGAGEMHVESGVVKRIVACSLHYWPDVALNRQVVDELYRKGYTRADDIILEECNYKCDVDRAVHSDL